MAVKKNVLNEWNKGQAKSTFDGAITSIEKIGFHWEAGWYDQRNKEDRRLKITLDQAAHTLTFIETGSVGPTQTWTGHYEIDQDGDYISEGEDSTHTYAYGMNITLPPS